MDGFAISGALWLGQPVLVWAGFLTLVAALLAADLGLFARRTPTMAQALALWAVYVAIGLAFAGVIYALYAVAQSPGLDRHLAAVPAGEPRALAAAKLYLTGYVVETALSMDNVFVISLIFGQFAVPVELRRRVLFWGVIGVIVLRGLLIGAGATLIGAFHWVLWLFAAFLVVAGLVTFVKAGADAPPSGARILRLVRRVVPVTETLRGERFFVREPDPDTGRMRRAATPLFVCLLTIELADAVFALDSVPAILTITQEPFLVYTSNIFAILGLRALYFALEALVARFYYLRHALALVLVFIGLKFFAGELVLDGPVPPELSLGTTLALLAGGVLMSLRRPPARTLTP